MIGKNDEYLGGVDDWISAGSPRGGGYESGAVNQSNTGAQRVASYSRDTSIRHAS